MGLTTLAIAALTGAALGYFLDPQSGSRRRALLRDQIVKVTDSASEQIQDLSEDAKNRAQGAMHEVRKQLQDEEVSDTTLVERVRSEMGRHVSRPGAIEISAFNGAVTLRGSIASTEVQALVNAVKAVPGVKGVNNQMQAHENADNLSDMQGGRSRTELP
jgi:osmotically-inducible protein OsmY